MEEGNAGSLRVSFEIGSAVFNQGKLTERQKGSVDSFVLLCPGDRVLVRNLTPRGGLGKLRAFWEEEIHVVVSRKSPESSVYDVKPESGRGKMRTLHRNLLLPCDYLPIKESAKRTKNAATERKPEQQTEKTSLKQVETDSDSEGEERPNQMDELVHPCTAIA